MKVALINSRQDKAGLNIRHSIETLLFGRSSCGDRTYEFFDVESRLIHADGVDRDVDCDLVIFLSRHASVNPVPVLTVHVTGNLQDAELGGSPRTLPPAAPAMMQAVLRELARRCPPGYRAAYEVTHHGPTDIRHPSFFVEIGSTEKEWADESAGLAVAESVLAACPADAVPLVGFGGNHYAARQTGIALSTRGAFGHIAHSREVGSLDAAIVRLMMEKTGAVAAHIDRKALSRHDLSHIYRLLDTEGIMRLSETDLAGMGSLPFTTYCAARDIAVTVAKGARCHVHALAGDFNPQVIRIDPLLFGEAIRADEGMFLEGLEKMPVIHITGQDNRPLPVFITSAEHRAGIINDLNTLCVKIIRIKEITATEGDHLIIQRVRFDPVKARELGVPKGPLYKELAEGRPITVNGRVITPAMVSTGSELKVHIPGLENIS
ncbi:MAG: D-tyrosyl-tRNA(Tyr) deacylase [Methanoregula sp. PtaU1.Bin051]|nr:MAG: D-tyrosyl-tRNA(Tyr) deacylase [Methanoregula sp. PtaU1.Bin051]